MRVMVKIQKFFNVLCVFFVILFLSTILIYLAGIPQILFVDLPKILEMTNALESKHKRDVLGLEQPNWRTPTRRLFKSESLQRVCNAIARIDSKELDKVLATNLDLNEVGEDGLTVLFFAYMEGDLPSFIKLLERGAKPDFPLSKALVVLNGHVRPRKGDTVLLAACNPYGRPRFLGPTLKHTDAPNQKNSNGMTGLHVFLSNFPFTGKEETVRALLGAGIDPLAIDHFGKTAIDYATIQAPELLPLLEKKNDITR